MAVTFVRPDKSIHEVKVSSVKKKLKDKAFAKGVQRDWIMRCEEIAGIEKEVKAFESILRYIIITTVRENTLVGSREAVSAATLAASKKGGSKEAGSETEASVETTPADETPVASIEETPIAE